MHTLHEFARLVQIANSLKLLENFFPINHDQYNSLFQAELKRLAMQTDEPRVRRELEDLEDFGFTAYIAAAVRNSGISDPREIDERIHEIASKLLLGKLFSFDPVSQPFAPRFKRSIANAVRNQVAKDQSRRRHLPSVSITNEPGMGVSPGEIAGRQTLGDEQVTEKFRAFLFSRLGEDAVRVFDQRLNGADVKELVGDGLTSYAIKQLVKTIKSSARDFFSDDPDRLAMIEKAFEAEARTNARRFNHEASRPAVDDE